MIVQCSNCLTRYSIDGAKVESSDNPRFHCSRCDHYFELNSAASKETPGAVVDFNEELAPPPKEGEQMSLLEAMSKPAPAIEQANYGISSVDDEELDEGFEAFSMEDELGEALSLPPHQSETESPLNETSNEATAEFLIPSIFEETNLEVAKEFSLDGSSENKIAEKSESELLRQFSINDLSIAAEIERTTIKSNFPGGPAVNWPSPQMPVLPGQVYDSSQTEFEQVKEHTEIGSTDIELPSSYYPSSSEAKNSSYIAGANLCFRDTWKKIAISCTIPLLLLATIFLLSQKMDQLPGVVKSYLALTPGDIEAVPPPGLQIVGLNSKERMLDNGTVLLDFSGEIFNASPTTIKDAVIEVRLFNREGHQIRRETAFSSGNLAEAESINSLQADTIKQMQQKPSRNPKDLNANGGRKRFKVLMLDPPGEASWYSARIYSVRPGGSGTG